MVFKPLADDRLNPAIKAVSRANTPNVADEDAKWRCWLCVCVDGSGRGSRRVSPSQQPRRWPAEPNATEPNPVRLSVASFPMAYQPLSIESFESSAWTILPGITQADAYVTDNPPVAPATPVRRQPVQESPKNYPLHPPSPPPRTPLSKESHSPSPSSPHASIVESPSPPPPPAPESPPSPPPKSPEHSPQKSPPPLTPESTSPQREPTLLAARSEPDLIANVSEIPNGDPTDEVDEPPIEDTAAIKQRIQQRRRRRTEPSSAALAASGGLPTRSSSGPRRHPRALHGSRSSLSRTRLSEDDWTTPESLNRSLQQLDGVDWEASAAALRSLARQLISSTNNTGTPTAPAPPHSGAAAQVHARLHVVCEALARQVRNLRSQVARAACDAAKSLFLALRRSADTETEDLVAALFHRTADTNKFLRADSNAALGAMADSLSPGRAVSVIVFKGCRHQNAIVRAEGARLLLRMVENLGVERIMAQPRETRDLLLVTATRLLMEGSLEARSYAKSLLRSLSRDPHLLGILVEIVPTNVMRNIDKTLKSLMRK